MLVKPNLAKSATIIPFLIEAKYILSHTDFSLFKKNIKV